MMNLPLHLSTGNAMGLSQNEPVAQFEIGSGKNFVYLILDWKTKRAAMVDPQSNLTLPLAALVENDFTLDAVFLTHTHHDHTAGVPALLKKFPELTVRVGEADVHRLPDSVSGVPGFKTLKDGESLKVGNLAMSAHHTPGHSAGEFCYFLESAPEYGRPYLFTGDTIFIRDCGRTDFDDGSNEELFHSIQKIKKFPTETVLLVGHHYAKECATTLGTEIRESPPFQCQSISELASLP